MTQEYNKCPTCGQWHAKEEIKCDGCGKIFSEKESKWTIYQRYPDEDIEPCHACSLKCLQEAMRKADYEHGSSAQITVKFDGAANYLLKILGVE